MAGSQNINKRINYCFVGDDGLAHLIVVIKWENRNLYFIDIGQPWKKSYHSPRNGLSQVHLKVNGFMPIHPDFCCPIEKIKGVRPIGGAGMELNRVSALPLAKNGNGINYILDTRPYHISPLSKIQWYHYLVEPGKEEDLQKYIGRKKDDQKMSEQIAFHKLDDSNPWIITIFTRICDENPLWYK